MQFARKFGEQLARPHGWAGRLLGAAMDVANRTPTKVAVDLLAPEFSEVILDAGCGTGAAMQEVLARADCHVTGIDRSPTMIDAAHRRLKRALREHRAELLGAEIGCLPFPDQCFSAVLALNILYFADAEGRMLQDLRRVMAPGARLVSYVTDRSTMERWAFAGSGTHRLYDEAALRDLFIAGGFDPTHIRIEKRPIARNVTGLFAIAKA